MRTTHPAATQLDVRRAVVSGDLVLNRTTDDDFVLHQVTDGEVLPLGTFRGSADAWRVLDALDDAAGL